MHNWEHFFSMVAEIYYFTIREDQMSLTQYLWLVNNNSFRRFVGNGNLKLTVLIIRTNVNVLFNQYKFIQIP